MPAGLLYELVDLALHFLTRSLVNVMGRHANREERGGKTAERFTVLAHEVHHVALVLPHVDRRAHDNRSVAAGLKGVAFFEVNGIGITLTSKSAILAVCPSVVP